MPKCKNSNTGTYKGTEPSPKGLGYCARGEKLGKKKKGRDGNMWEVKETKKGIPRWVKIIKTEKSNKKVTVLPKKKSVKKKSVKKKSVKKKKDFKYPTLLEQMKDNPWMEDILVKKANNEALTDYEKDLFKMMKEQPLPKGGIDQLIKKFKKKTTKTKKSVKKKSKVEKKK